MLGFKDFFHLPELDPLIAQLAGDGAGLILVAGLDPRPAASSETVDSFLPSGRATIFRILMRQLLEEHPERRAIVVCKNKETVRIHRQLKRQVEYALVHGSYSYEGHIAAAIDDRPDLLVIDEINLETAALALQAAQSGLRVLSQIDTIFRGAEIIMALRDFGAQPEQLVALRWVVSVQRLPALCHDCRQAQPPVPAAAAERLQAHVHLFDDRPSTFFKPAGCAKCNGRGYEGEVAVFDIFHNPSQGQPLSEQPSLFSQEAYALRLAAAGYLSLEDVLNLETNRLHHTYGLLTASERALSQTNSALQRKVVELEAARYSKQCCRAFFRACPATPLLPITYPPIRWAAIFTKLLCEKAHGFSRGMNRLFVVQLFCSLTSDSWAVAGAKTIKSFSLAGVKLSRFK